MKEGEGKEKGMNIRTRRRQGYNEKFRRGQ
jgi:hypothetical protein